MSLALRSLAAMAILACAAGCASSLRSISASLVGCVLDEVEISNESRDYAGIRWTARCGGHEYTCSEGRRGGVGNAGPGTVVGSSESAVCVEAATTPRSAVP